MKEKANYFIWLLASFYRTTAGSHPEWSWRQYAHFPGAQNSFQTTKFFRESAPHLVLCFHSVLENSFHEDPLPPLLPLQIDISTREWMHQVKRMIINQAVVQKYQYSVRWEKLAQFHSVNRTISSNLSFAQLYLWSAKLREQWCLWRTSSLLFVFPQCQDTDRAKQEPPLHLRFVVSLVGVVSRCLSREPPPATVRSFLWSRGPTLCKHSCAGYRSVKNPLFPSLQPPIQPGFPVRSNHVRMEAANRGLSVAFSLFCSEGFLKQARLCSST